MHKMVLVIEYFIKICGQGQGKDKGQAVKSLLDNTLMVWCDCSENITDSMEEKMI